MAQGSGDDPGASLVACQLTLAASATRPGETVTALLQVSCLQPEALELQEVEIEFTGVERVDTSWVLPTYRRATPAINTDKRKVQRYVVQTRLQAAAQGTFSDLSLRRFVVRFTLPSWLPPTFRGTAVRYVYYLQATVKYRSTPPADGGANDAAAAAGSGNGSGRVSSRVPLHIWPAKQQQLETAMLERTPSLLSPSSAAGSASGAAAPAAAAAAADGSLLSPPIQSEDVPIKCWEIGPGTAVQDAVAHILKLASQPPSSPGRPQSPGHLPRGNSGGGAGGRSSRGLPGAGSGDVAGAADNQSEISHEPDEVEMGPASGSAPSAAAAEVAAQQPAPPPLRVPPPQQQAQQQAQQQQQQDQAALSSGASTPRSTSRLAVRRSSLTRPSLDPSGSLVQPRSPTQLQHDSGSTLRSYALRIGEQPLVRVSLHPPLEGSLQPGATLAGTLDFTQHFAVPVHAADEAALGSTAHGPRCMQVLILLETEEIVEQPWRRQVQGGGSGAIRRVYDEHLELTGDTACTHFLFTIPPDAPVTFQTPLLQLRWVLRFQFTASMPPAGGGSSSSSRHGEGHGASAADWSPLQGQLEQLSWVLPITLLPPAA